MISYTLKPTPLFCSTDFKNGDDFILTIGISTPVTIAYIHDEYICLIYCVGSTSYIGFIPDSSMVYYE